MLAERARESRATLGFSTKTYFSAARTLAWLDAVLQLEPSPTIQRFIVPSFPVLEGTIHVAGGELLVGAQNCSAHPAGAHTGEVSAQMLAEIGVDFVELGHAEQRADGDTDDVIARKVSQAHEHRLDVLLCVGEGVPGDPEMAAKECVRQIEASGVHLSEAVIAYEPVWAIGAESPAPIQHIVNTVASIKATVKKDIPVLYGGTAGPGLLGDIYPTVDGLFLGRRAHDPESFASVVREAEQLTGRTT